MLAPSPIVGPPAYTGVSWTNRPDTRLGATMTAFASAGISTLFFTFIVTRAKSAPGSIESIVPTFTPRTRTSSPEYSPVVAGKYAVIVFWKSLGTNITAAPTISTTTTAATPPRISHFFRVLVISGFVVIAAVPSARWTDLSAGRPGGRWGDAPATSPRR